MEGTPTDVDLEAIIQTITQHGQVQNVHDYHVWTISNDMNALSCHAVVSEALTVEQCELLLERIEHDLSHLNVHHMTIQLETPKHKHDTSTYVQDFIIHMLTYTSIKLKAIVSFLY